MKEIDEETSTKKMLKNTEYGIQNTKYHTVYEGENPISVILSTISVDLWGSKSAHTSTSVL